MIPLTNHDFQWGRSEVVIIYPEYSDPLWGVNLAENLKTSLNQQKNIGDSLGRVPWRKQKKQKQRNRTHWRSCNPHGSALFFLFLFLVFCFGGAEHIYIYIHTTHGWFEMPISFFWEWQAVGARCFISFDHHTQKRDGGVVSAFFLHVWHFIFAKDTKPCSFHNQTLLLL